MSEEKNHAEAVRWLETARGDLATARVLLSNERYAHSCFHAQQAAEKTMNEPVALRWTVIPGATRCAS